MALQVKGKFQTKQEWLCDQLREAIRTCELMPGQRLVMDELAANFGVSRVPVREAILQLQSEGLVSVVPHAGAVVAPISSVSANDYFAISRSLQVVAVRAASERLTPEERTELEALVSQMEKAAEAKDYESYTAVNHEFHRFIARASKMPLLPHLLDEVERHWQRVERYYGLYPMAPDRVQETIGEHRRLAEAILSGAADAAEQASREHNITGLNNHLRRMAEKERSIEKS